MKRKVIYFAPGGYLGEYVKMASNFERNILKDFCAIAVQGHYIKNELIRYGLNNVLVVPNFKPIIYTPKTKQNNDSKVKFVFVSRIRQDKGVDDIIGAIKKICNPSVSVDFYGVLQDKYSIKYFESLKDYNINYCGYLDFRTKNGYDLMSKYDAMIFPTYHDGEGFPGVVLDSFIAGVPPIVSNYHANPEIVKNGVNGIVIAPKNVDELSEAMETIINKPELRSRLRENAITSAKKYDVDIVLSQMFDDLHLNL